jgi:guanidinoacetate N-methyltransferase
MASIHAGANGRVPSTVGLPRYPALAREWGELPVEITEHELRVGGWQVMQAWERPLMEVMAREVSEQRGDVLEIGYGMGMAARMIVDAGCTSYTTIEAHPAIAEIARTWAAMQGVPCTVIEGMWEDVVPRLSTRFDGILFDTFPLSAEERGRNHFPFIPQAPQLLRKNGVLVYYSDESADFRAEHLALLLADFNEVKLIKVADLRPGDDCEYWQKDQMIVPVARRS